MISFQREPTVIASGCQLTAVVRVSLAKRKLGGRWLVAGDKRPIAVICLTEDGEYIFDTNGHQISAVELKELMTDQGE